MAESLRFGFIGAGEIALRTAEAVSQVAQAQLVAVTDADPRLAQDLAAGHGAQAVETADDLVARADVDAVYIAVPHFLHPVMVQTAARAGKHILLEKPTGTSAAEAERSLRAARDGGVVLSVPFVYRYTEAWRRVRELVADGILGDMQSLRSVLWTDKPATYWQGGYTGRSQSDWRGRALQAGGGVLIMNAVHDIDAMRWSTGLEAERVYAEHGTFAARVEVEDLAAVTIRYHGGAIGVIELAAHAPGGAGPVGSGGHRWIGTQGQAVLEDGHLWVYGTREGGGVRPGRWTELELRQPGDPRVLCVADFARAVLAGERPPVPEDAGLEAMKVVSAAYQSQRLGRPVRTDEVFQKVVMAPRTTIG